MDNQLRYKEILWRMLVEKGRKLLAEGLNFFAKGEPERYNNIEVLKEEIAVGARYLHRGYYCPSLIRDITIDNSKRGRLLVRPTKNSKISHRYIYGPDGNLMIIQASLPDGRKKEEYLVRKENAIYGFSFDAWGTLIALSEEVYDCGKLKSYFCASCFNHVADKFDLGITSAYYEKYDYSEAEWVEVDCYFINFWDDTVEDADEIDSMLKGDRYRLVQDNGRVTGFHAVDINGNSP